MSTTLHLRRGEPVTYMGRQGNIVAVGKGVVYILFDGERRADVIDVGILTKMVENGTASVGR